MVGRRHHHLHPTIVGFLIWLGILLKISSYDVAAQSVSLTSANNVYNQVTLSQEDGMFWYQVDTKGATFEARGEHTASLVGQKIFINSGCSTLDRCFSGMVGLNLESNYWFECTLLHTPPASRKQHSATVVGTIIYIIGGFQPSTMYFPNDAITFDTRSTTWSTPSLGGVNLLPRAGHTATLVGSNKIFVIGGYSDIDFYDNLYVLNTALQKWDQPVVRGVRPTPRRSHSETLVGTVIYIYGGYSQEAQSLSDLYSLDTVTMTWTKIQATGVAPPPIQGHTAILMNSKIFLFGGCTYGNGKSTCSNAIYQFDTKHTSWKRIRAQGTQPSPREGHTALMVGYRMYIVGGCMLDSNCYSSVYYLDTYPCHGACNYNGTCQNGQCQCFPGYTGYLCDRIEEGCPANCSMRGVCRNASCDCYGGFTGFDCLTPKDPDGALNETYVHLTPEIVAAHPGQNFNPTQTRKDVIDFRPPGQPVYPANSGVALCLNNCSGNGQCNKGKCFCYFGYGAQDCSIAKEYALCPNNCSGNGRCDHGQCQCYTGFSGADCGTAPPIAPKPPTGCPSDCSNHGRCVNDSCVCYRGYYSDDCSLVAYPRCPNDCSGHGTCDTKGACTCQWGWGAANCSISLEDTSNNYRILSSERSSQLQGGLSSTNLTVNVVHEHFTDSPQADSVSGTAASPGPSADVTQESSASTKPIQISGDPPPAEVAASEDPTEPFPVNPHLKPQKLQGVFQQEHTLPSHLPRHNQLLTEQDNQSMQESIEVFKQYAVYAGLLVAVGAASFVLLHFWGSLVAQPLPKYAPLA